MLVSFIQVYYSLIYFVSILYIFITDDCYEVEEIVFESKKNNIHDKNFLVPVSFNLFLLTILKLSIHLRAIRISCKKGLWIRDW